MGLGKYYERMFKPFENGHLYSTRKGLKFVSESEKSLLVDSYRMAVRFRFKQIMLAVVLMMALVLVGVIADMLLSPGFDLLNLTAYLAVGGMTVWLILPIIRHYHLEYSVLKNARIIPDMRSKSEKRADIVAITPWWMLVIGLLISFQIGFVAVADGIQGWVDGAAFVFACWIFVTSARKMLLKLREQ
ncbi:MAG: hypothetical protein AAF067_08770 [Pseudomonadota bacterium]